MKFVIKKVIGGKTYYYLQYNEHSSYVGESVPKNIKELLLNFFTQIGEKEAKKLNKKVTDTFKPKNPVILEIMRHIFILMSRNDLFSEDLVNYLNTFTLHFTFNSNRSEGSQVTRKEIEQISLRTIRKPKTRTEREVLNSLAALQFAFSDKFRWNPLNVRKLHTLLMRDLDDPLIVGKWKKENVVAPGNQPTTSPAHVAKEMKELFVWFEERRKKKMYPPLLASEFYVRFEAIHPFTDGNGRVGRILLNAILLRFDYMPVVFFTQNHEAHCRAITRAISGKHINFRHHLLDQAKKTMNLIKIHGQAM